jgi:hypothetical protein
LELLHASEPPEHEADHGEVDPGLTGGAEPLILAAESAVAQQPGESPLDHPPSGQHVEAWGGQILRPINLLRWDVVRDPVAFEAMSCAQDLDRSTDDRLHPVGAFAASIVAGIQPQMLHAGQARSRRCIEDDLDAIAVHHVGGMDVDRQEQPFGIH